MSIEGFDEQKAKAFSDRMVGVLNSGALALMCSLGHRTRLFDVMAEMSASTSEQISAKAGLNERYVREWLAAMVTGGFVEYDIEAKSYRLPREHAAFVTRAVGADNIATFTQYFSMLGSVEDDIVACFVNGGGVPYERFRRFHEVMAEDSGLTVVTSLVDRILPLAAGVSEVLRSGAEALDLGCGSGKAVLRLAEEFPESSFTGYDFSREAIGYAETEAKCRGFSNVHFEVRDVSELNETGRFAFITAFDAIHDQAKPALVLAEVSRALATGGTFLMQDIRASSHVHKNMKHPIAPFLYTISTMHCMTVSLALGGDGLGTMWGRELAETMLSDAGFTRVDVHTLDHDAQNFYYVARKS